jgi:CHAP domain-containing protein
VTAAAAVLAVAAREIGYHEAADGSNRYGAAYGMDRVAWCNQFVWWCMGQAGAAALIPKSAYTPTTASWYQQRGAADRSPRPGDLVFYNWPGDGVDRIQHVGFVERVVNASTIQTIEGNTTSGSGGNQSDGGFVARRTRCTSAVVLYGHPAYDGAAPPPPPAADGSGLATLSYGMRNDSRVAAFQRQSNAYNWQPELPVIPATGNYLDQTKALVARIQAAVAVTGSDADGSVIGPRTKAELARRGFRW